MKKIIATESISYREALDFKKNNLHTFAFKYFEIVNRQSIPTEITSVPTSFKNIDFPNLNPNHHFFNFGKKIKTHPSTQQKYFSLPNDSLLPLLNGSYLNTYAQNSQRPTQNPNDFSWDHPLFLKLSESLINFPTLLPLSPLQLFKT